MDRRAFVRGAGSGAVAGLAGLAGCLTRTGETDDPAVDEGPLRVVTYSSLATGPTPAGEWLRETVADEFSEEVEWHVPGSGIDHYIRRAQLGADIGADVVLGLTAAELALVDAALDGDTQLFASLDRSRLEHADRVRATLEFEEPRDRALPVDTGYLTLVYDAVELERPPETFDDLLAGRLRNELLAQDPRTSDPGRAFLLWTVAEFGSDFTAYWQDLRDNGVRLCEHWTEAYRDSYLDGDRPLVVSYSTDRVAASAADRDLRRHRIAPLNGTGYRQTEGVALFADATRTDLAYEFVDLLLSSAAQAELATRNVQFPAVDPQFVDLDDRFPRYAQEPPETVTLGYDDLRGELDGWLAAVADELPE
ncbi:thiamine ABC transporter substrate-binding protein [Natrialba asiatica]|uniref:ABC transporter substrate-binding protein n=1 Tax=Natrialba asiatica (strain ATCC 700177 / DSM 12278 / JCM 9576 / FERM P-10747 / NBRC 102637 / 172P1) TaxID=29540 RepID=M0AH37_NATA1|nr:thiamine ABC transporter substrate-binding protein [Natrialba asiatica]ELY97990.1 ABC transporter substrate-binding protein [Natrialba asiatica DSM 12278]